MARPPTHDRSYQEPPTVALTDRLASVLPSSQPDPEASLIAAQEGSQRPSRRRRLDLTGLLPGDHIAIELWLSGLTQLEIAVWLGATRQRVTRRISRGIADLRAKRR